MTAHARAQLARFARLTLLALSTQLLVTGGKFPDSWSSLWLLIPGAAETALRQVVPVKPLPRVTAVPAPPEPPGAPGAAT